MNTGNILASVLTLVKPVVLTIEAIEGQKTAGASKATMAQTALTGALAGAGLVLGGANAKLAGLVGGLFSKAIDVAVSNTKQTGEYQEASSVAASLAAQLTGAQTTTDTAEPATAEATQQ